MDLIILTFNARADVWSDGKRRWKHRKESVINLLKAQQPDIVGLQEINFQMLQDLKNYFPTYQFVGESRTTSSSGEHNCLMISKEHQLIETKTFWLSKKPQKKGSSIWYSLFPRICTVAHLQLLNGLNIQVFNTHLDCYHSPARKYGLTVILDEMIKAYQSTQSPMILMGDFNTSPEQPLLKRFKQQLRQELGIIAVQETRKELYKQPTYCGFSKWAYPLHLDYIFSSPEFQVNEVEILKEQVIQEPVQPSDHYPLRATLTLKQPLK